MDCKEAQARIPDYIKGTLPSRELENFISHIRKCPVCHEELETYFTIHLAVATLDNDKPDFYNFSGKLEKDIEEKEHMLRRGRMARRFLIVSALILLLAVFGVMIARYEILPVL